MEARPLAGRVAVLTNPTAGRRRHQRILPQILDRLRQSGHELVPVSATDAEQAEVACRRAVAEGAAALVAVGGDGTQHAALQAVAGTPVPYAAVPAGTGNDFATALGAPADPLRAAEAVATALRERRTRRFDLARVTGADGRHRWYGTVLAAGFDAIVNERGNRLRWPRGASRYDVAIFLELVRLRARRYRIRLDGEPVEVDAVLVAVGNTACYGGGIRICPAAVPTDGLLEVVVGRRMGRLTLARLRPRAYRGTHVRHRLVDSYHAREVGLELVDDEVVAYADGERCLPLPVTVTAVAGALTAVTP